jgi:holliday junction DNA helicase RuvA
MIGYLRGEIVLKEEDFIIVDTKGVGYKVLVAKDVLVKAQKGASLELFVHTHVREDNISLFGFLDIKDLKLFEKLIGISGVGAKTAMNIFSRGHRREIIDAIIKANIEFFSSVPRLGRKNAQKIIIELKNQFGGNEDIDLLTEDQESSNEIISALMGFGFSRKEAVTALSKVDKKVEKVEDKIRKALRYLGK